MQERKGGKNLYAEKKGGKNHWAGKKTIKPLWRKEREKQIMMMRY